MTPVQEILSRIRWDKQWAEDDFQIGYYDRVERRIMVVPFKQILFPGDDHFSFDLIDRTGEARSVPYHRVRAIYRNGRLIWHRDPE